jgi:hypothetical protein
MKKILLIFFIFNLSAILFADPRGDEIARKHYDLPEENDSYSIARMILVNSRGDKKIRKLVMYTKKTKVGTNSFIEFEEPADVRGSRFLTIGYKGGDDDQRLYLPALGKIRKISSSNKDGSFMGSDLNYFDMEDHDYSDYRYKFIKDEIYEGRDCFVIEMVSKDENAPYSKQLMWIAKDNYFIYKTECYSKKNNKLEKTIVFLNVTAISGILTAKRMVVENYLKNHKTLLQIDEKRNNIGVKDSIFSLQNLAK